MITSEMKKAYVEFIQNLPNGRFDKIYQDLVESQNVERHAMKEVRKLQTEIYPLINKTVSLSNLQIQILLEYISRKM